MSDGTLYYRTNQPSLDPEYDWQTDYKYATVPQNFTLQITKLTSEYVKGTFSGDLYRNVSNRIDKKEARNGEFLAYFEY